MAIFVIPTNYAVIAPGGLTQLAGEFEIEGIEMDEHFYSIHVYGQEPITIFQYLMVRNNDYFEVTEMTQRQSDTSYLDSITQGNISKDASYKTALIKAYELASTKDDSINISYNFNGLTIYDYPRRVEGINIGDTIIKINGISIKDMTFEEAEVLAYQRDVTYTILNDNEESYDYHYVYDETDVVFWFFPAYEITDASPKFDYGNFHLIGGPSGGLLQTLMIYSSLLKLNIENLVIAGTGTIEMTGDVGRIGGIREKITTASWHNVDVFFIPKSHLDEIDDLSYTYILVPVETLDEAVNWLYENLVR